MNYISKIILEVLEERFKDDKFYLSEKKAEIKKHKDKFDGLYYLFNKCDVITQKEAIKKLALYSGWEFEEDDIENMIHFTHKFLSMV